MVPGLRVQEFHIGSFKRGIVLLKERVCEGLPRITVRSYVAVVSFHVVVFPKFCDHTVGGAPRSWSIQFFLVLLNNMMQHNSCWVFSTKVLSANVTNE